MFPVLLFTLLACAGLAQAPAGSDVTRLTLAPAKAVAEIDTGKLKGEPARLAWNTDGSFYVRTVEVDRFLNERAHHFLITTGTPEPAAGEPPWASSYWAWKSERYSPADATFAIDIESRQQTMRSTSPAKGGDIAGMGGDVTAGGAGQGMPTRAGVDAAMTSQQATTVTARVKGQVVGEWTNEQPQPGKRLGWAPKPLTALAYVDTRKRLMLVDREGRTREVPGAVDVMLPAWSPDGKRIAYLQKKDKKKYALMVIEVGGE